MITLNAKYHKIAHFANATVCCVSLKVLLKHTFSETRHDISTTFWPLLLSKMDIKLGEYRVLPTNL